MPTFEDASTNNNAGALIGVTAATPGPLARSVAPLFDRLGWLSRTGSMPALPLNAPYSIEYWVNIMPGTVGWMDPVGWSTTPPQPYSRVYVTTDAYQDGAFGQDLEVYHSSGQYAYLDEVDGEPGYGAPQDGIWHHVVLTNSGAAGADAYLFYLDAVPLSGLFVGGDLSTQQADATHVFLGNGPSLAGWGEAIKGGLAHVAIYARVLAAAEVLAHYNAAGYYTFAATLAGVGTRTRNRAQPLAAALAPVGVRGRGYPQTTAGTLTPTGSRSHVLAPWAFTRGTFLQPQHAPRTLATPEGASPLRAIPTGDTTATDAVLAPDDANIAYYLDWSNTLPAGFGISSISAQALMRPDAATAWSAATDVTSTFVNATAQLGMQTRVIVADGNQTLGQQYRIRLLAAFSNSPATILEAFFDLTVAET